jgi:hypothetical protein
MSGQGFGGPTVGGVVAGAGAAAVLPQTGMNSVVEIALAVAAGLAAWAVVYVASAKIAKR